jgi:hypothetical protein
VAASVGGGSSGWGRSASLEVSHGSRVLLGRGHEEGVAEGDGLAAWASRVDDDERWRLVRGWDGSRARLLGIEPGRLARGDRRALGADAHGAVDDVDGDGVVAGDFVGDGRRRLELGVEQRDRNLELLDVGAGMSGDGADMETGGCRCAGLVREEMR